MRSRQSKHIGGRTTANQARSNTWYVAQFIKRITVGGDARSVVHVNYVLLEATSAEVAYAKAIRLGSGRTVKYKNPEGQNVVIRSVGLRELSEVYEPLSDGAEIMYTEHVGMSATKTRQLVRAKKNLAVFRTNVILEAHPNYASADILNEAKRRVQRESEKGKARRKKV